MPMALVDKKLYTIDTFYLVNFSIIFTFCTTRWTIIVILMVYDYKLTLDVENDSLADRWRYAIRSDAQIRSHVRSTDPG
jgi:hypothetical protein